MKLDVYNGEKGYWENGAWFKEHKKMEPDFIEDHFPHSAPIKTKFVLEKKEKRISNEQYAIISLVLWVSIFLVFVIVLYLRGL